MFQPLPRWERIALEHRAALLFDPKLSALAKMSGCSRSDGGVSTRRIIGAVTGASAGRLSDAHRELLLEHFRVPR